MPPMTWRLPLLLLCLLCACAGSKRSKSSDADDASSDGSSGDEPEGADLDRILDAHNDYRKKHCAPPLEWSDDLADTAQRWADKLKKRGCGFSHSDSPYGENLAAGTEGTMGAERATEIWYEEKQHHNFRSGNFSMRAGHFTQLVWVGSERLGCGTTRCNGKQIWVCNYDPPGNVQGQFKTNVRPTGCKKK
jgi:uncharacterized protein YkwD